MTPLLTLAAITDGMREDEPVELSEVVRTALPASTRIAASLHPTIVRGDAVLLGRAAADLVDNALRHGHATGRVTVPVRNGELNVANAGSVIAPADLPWLTQPFERLRRGSSPGAGLGLSIVKAIAESHGGRLTLDTPADGGMVASDLHLSRRSSSGSFFSTRGEICEALPLSRATLSDTRRRPMPADAGQPPAWAPRGAGRHELPAGARRSREAGADSPRRSSHPQ
jgi:hypothetical protein